MIEIAKYDLEGNFLEILKDDNLNKIAVSEGIEYRSFQRAIENVTLSAGGFQWKKVDKNTNTPLKIGFVYHISSEKTIGKNSYKIGKYFKGRFITSYSNLTEMALKNKIDDFTDFSRRFKQGKSKAWKGFEFKLMK